MAAEPKESPRISIKLALEPAEFALGDDLPTFKLTATSHATEPITVFTWNTILALRLSQLRGSFTCFDLTAQKEVVLNSSTTCRKYGFDRTEGGGHDKYFVTLEPGVPYTFTHPFELGPGNWIEGHRYRCVVEDGEHIWNWWYGRREDVMVPRPMYEKLFWFRRRRRGLLPSSGESIEPDLVAPMEFEVLEAAFAKYMASGSKSG
jgi:hypothetical protein